jgi:hypothetical protein
VFDCVKVGKGNETGSGELKNPLSVFVVPFPCDGWDPAQKMRPMIRYYRNGKWENLQLSDCASEDIELPVKSNAVLCDSCCMGPAIPMRPVIMKYKVTN